MNTKSKRWDVARIQSELAAWGINTEIVFYGSDVDDCKFGEDGLLKLSGIPVEDVSIQVTEDNKVGLWANTLSDVHYRNSVGMMVETDLVKINRLYIKQETC